MFSYADRKTIVGRDAASRPLTTTPAILPGQADIGQPVERRNRGR